MNIKEFQKITLGQFNGLYARGVNDEVPQDHASICNNIMFGKKGEFSSRFGMVSSLAVSHPVKRMFLSTINANLVPLTLDNSGNIYAGLGGFLYSNPNMIDFSALNIFNKTLILPILNRSDPSVKLKIWDGTVIRNIGALAPTNTMTAADDTVASNQLSVGVYKFAVSYVTSTGFVTVPSAPLSVTADGFRIILSNIPTGPVGTVSRQILVTKSGLNLFYYLRLINDNTTTSMIADFFDTDLAVSADRLFDLVSVIAGNGVGGLDKYHGRVIVFGGENDLVRVSNPGDAESYDNIDGYIQIPSENDGNIVAATFQITDNLYFTKMPGIYTVNDNGGVPSSWPIIPLDGGCGAMGYGVSTITAGQKSLNVNNSCLIADLDGIFVFNGVTQRPALTWKINDLWKSYVNIGNISKITIFVDPFAERFYVSIGDTAVLLVADFSEGWAYNSIKWSVWTFANNIQSIAMATLVDSQFEYALRVGFDSVNGLFKMKDGIFDDLGVPISSNIRFAPLSFGEGQLSIFRGIRVRALRSGGSVPTNLYLNLYDEGNNHVGNPPQLSIDVNSATDYLRQINYTGEKLAVDFSVFPGDSYFKVHRVDVFGKPIWASRPG